MPRHASRTAAPLGTALGAAGGAPPGRSMLLPAASGGEGGERGAGSAAHSSRCC